MMLLSNTIKGTVWSLTPELSLSGSLTLALRGF